MAPREPRRPEEEGCPGRREQAVDDQKRESMHEAPRRHGREVVVEWPLVEIGDAAQQ